MKSTPNEVPINAPCPEAQPGQENGGTQITHDLSIGIKQDLVFAIFVSQGNNLDTGGLQNHRVH